MECAKIRNCLFHYEQSIERKRKHYFNLYNNNSEVRDSFKRIRTLPLIPCEYVIEVFDLIKAKNTFEELEEFFNYFHSTYIERYDIEFWNYYNEEYLRTNNPCESYNNRLNSYFEKKTNFLSINQYFI